MRNLSMLLMPGVVVLGLSRPAAAITGNEALRLCQVDNLACISLMDGMLDGYGTAIQINLPGQQPFHELRCVPASSTKDQAREIFVNFLRTNPEVRHLNSTMLYIAALVEVFPCPEDEKKP